MKRFIILLSLAVIATSCSIMQPQQRAEYVSFLDYRPYTSAGFFLSPDSHTGRFEAIGQLDITIIPEQISANSFSSNGNGKFSDSIYSSKPSLSYKLKEIPAEELLELAYKNAVDKGANGIANLEIKRVTSTTYTKYRSSTSLSHYEISGYLIKVLD